VSGKTVPRTWLTADPLTARGGRGLVIRWGPFSRRPHSRVLWTAACLFILLPLLFVLALTVGSGGVEPASLLHALSPDATAAERLVFEWRGSRALAAALFGACLAIGGALFQTLTRNPLGSPEPTRE